MSDEIGALRDGGSDHPQDMPVAEARLKEQPHLLALAEGNFGTHETLYPLIVDGKRRMKVKTNWYSVPLWIVMRAMARLWQTFINIERDSERVARHPRHYGRHGRIDAAAAMA